MLHSTWPEKATSLAQINPKKPKVNAGNPVKDSEDNCTCEPKFNLITRMTTLGPVSCYFLSNSLPDREPGNPFCPLLHVLLLWLMRMLAFNVKMVGRWPM